MTFIAIFGLGYIFCPKAIFCPNTKNKGGEGQGKGDPAGDEPARDQTRKALSEAQTNGTSKDPAVQGFDSVKRIDRADGSLRRARSSQVSARPKSIVLIRKSTRRV